jgi:hypothetical protein
MKLSIHLHQLFIMIKTSLEVHLDFWQVLPPQASFSYYFAVARTSSTTSAQRDQPLRNRELGSSVSCATKPRPLDKWNSY